eukprot:344134-Rhodomonas_salina.2
MSPDQVLLMRGAAENECLRERDFFHYIHNASRYSLHYKKCSFSATTAGGNLLLAWFGGKSRLGRGLSLRATSSLMYPLKQMRNFHLPEACTMSSGMPMSTASEMCPHLRLCRVKSLVASPMCLDKLEINWEMLFQLKPTDPFKYLGCRTTLDLSWKAECAAVLAQENAFFFAPFLCWQLNTIVLKLPVGIPSALGMSTRLLLQVHTGVHSVRHMSKLGVLCGVATVGL